MRNARYAICDTLDEFKENRLRFLKRSFGWDMLEIISSDTPILDSLFFLGEFILFLCSRKKRR